MKINPAAASKINWTQGVAFVAALAAVFGLDISESTRAAILTGLATVVPVVTFILRTWFTAKPSDEAPGA